MRKQPQPLTLIRKDGQSPSPHSSAWARALSEQSDAARRAILARQQLDEIEAAAIETVGTPDKAALAAHMTRWRQARHQLYRALHALAGFQAHVLDLAHGDRILEGDDTETGLPVWIVEDLAAALCRDEDGGR